ncbi:hypothetical protein GQ457_01G044740 [Hibiscus cannabinus]
MKLERGSYSCVKPGCNYVVHVNCVLEDTDLYDVIEHEELGAATQSSIIRVIEENEDGTFQPSRSLLGVSRGGS